MFSQVFVILSLNRGGGQGGVNQGPSHNTSLPPGPGHNTSPSPDQRPDQVTTPPPPPGPETRPSYNTSLFPPPVPETSEASEGYVFTGVCHSVTEQGGGGREEWTRDLVTTPPPQDQRPDQVTTPPPPDQRPDQVSIPPPPSRDYAQAGGTHPTGMHTCCLYVFLLHLNSQEPMSLSGGVPLPMGNL